MHIQEDMPFAHDIRSCLHMWSVQIAILCPGLETPTTILQSRTWVCRAIITAHSCLLFEPNNPQSKKFLECVTPRLTANEGARVLAEYRRDHDDYSAGESEQPPFELEMVEGALMVATGTCEPHCLHSFAYELMCQYV